MYILQIAFGTPAFDEAVQLRYEVLRRPLGLTYTEEQLAEEYDQVHLAAYSNHSVLIGYLNLTPQDVEVIKMRQVAVAPDCQGKGVGKELVKAAEDLASQSGYKRMVLHARETAVPFYKALEYNSVGAQFEEVGIPHFRMEKAL